MGHLFAWGSGTEAVGCSGWKGEFEGRLLELEWWPHWSLLPPYAAMELETAGLLTHRHQIKELTQLH